MTYEEALRFIADRGRFGELGLSRIRRLLAMLGHPEERYAAIHVAGTNGKGSTTAILAAMLSAARRRVGHYISPPLLDPRERIQVDGRPIGAEELAQLVTELAKGPLSGEIDPATEFEVWTALAFAYFARRAVEWAVVEVGLGGRFDATNALRRPRVTVITSIGWDHADRLGPTLAAIAREKAGILKPDVPAVVGRLPAEAMAVVEEAARARGVPLERLGADFEAEGCYEGGTWWLHYQSSAWEERFPLALAGRHQADNAALAVRVAELLHLPPEAVRQGLVQVRWPGRLELYDRGRLILDGAHNPQAMAALADALQRMFPGERFRVVFGCLRDRDPEQLLEPIVPILDELVLVEVPSARAWSLPELCEQLAAFDPVVGDLGAELAASRGRRVVTGSLYLVAEALRRLSGERGSMA